MNISNPTRKTILFAASALVGAAIFAAGFAAGAKVLAAIIGKNDFNNSLMDYAQIQISLESLDNNDIDEARKFLKSQSDSSIIEIDALAKQSSGTVNKKACELLQNIGRHRTEHPELYKDASDADKYASEILTKWQQYDCERL